jgi:hypothetical protein
MCQHSEATIGCQNGQNGPFSEMRGAGAGDWQSSLAALDVNSHSTRGVTHSTYTHIVAESVEPTMFDQQNNSGQRDKKCLQLHCCHFNHENTLPNAPTHRASFANTALRLTSETHANHGMGAPKTIKTEKKCFVVKWLTRHHQSCRPVGSVALRVRSSSHHGYHLQVWRTHAHRPQERSPVASSPATGVCFQRRNSATRSLYHPALSPLP